MSRLQTYRKITKEFKLEAVQLSLASNKTVKQVAEELARLRHSSINPHPNPLPRRERGMKNKHTGGSFGKARRCAFFGIDADDPTWGGSAQPAQPSRESTVVLILGAEMPRKLTRPKKKSRKDW